jgi:uncharacterized protein (TIGR03437 family)
VKRILGLFPAMVLLCLAGTQLPALAQSDEVSIIQITNLLGAPGSFARGMSDDGKRIVFESTNNFAGNNPDFNNEIFVYDADLRTIIQITNTKNVLDPADATKILLNVSNHAPAISGDGRRIVFSSNSGALTGTTNDDGNQEIYLATLPRNSTTVSFVRLTDTEANQANETVKEIFTNFSPTINSDGTRIAFVSTRRVFKALENGTPAFTASNEGPNNDQTPDGNAEIFLYNLTTRLYTQVTRSRDVDATVNFQVLGFNNSPFLSGDGSRLVFLSGFNYPGANAGNNADFNAEVFLYNVGDSINTFTQVTNTTGASVVPVNGPVNVLSAFTRHLNHAGTLLVFESSGDFAGKNSDRTREVFLYNITAKTFTQITNQPAPDANLRSDFNFFPGLNAAGTFVTFGSVLNLVPTTPSDVRTDNGDGSREVFRYDIVNSTPDTPKFRQVTFTPPAGTFDDRNNTVSAYIDSAGNSLMFTSGENLIGTNSDFSSEIFQARIRPITSQNAQAAALVNAASFDGTAVARGSMVSAFGTLLADATTTASSADLPFELNGVTVTVGFAAARVIFVSPGQINFVFPAGIAPADAVKFTVNNNGVLSTGMVKVVDASPGIFTVASGTGPAAAQCGRISDDGMRFEITLPPCSVGNESLFDVLTIYGTGWRNASNITVTIDGTPLTPSFAGAQPDFLGLDQINVSLVKALAGKTGVTLTVTATVGTTTATSQMGVTISFLPFEESVTIANAASFSSFAIAPNSTAAAFGANLANATLTAPSNDLPFVLGGVSVQVAGVAARLAFVSPGQVNFVVPPGVAPADQVAVAINNNGTILTGRIRVANVAPGIFTAGGSGSGSASAQCGQVLANNTEVLSSPPCSVGTEAAPRFLVLLGTGWRNAATLRVTIGGTELTPTSFGPQAGVFGIDRLQVTLVSALAGRTDAEVVVRVLAADGSTIATSQTGVTISFLP